MKGSKKKSRTTPVSKLFYIKLSKPLTVEKHLINILYALKTYILTANL